MPRSRAFDEEALLEAAVELFWANGYARTSLAELTDRTGVTNGSLYQAYRSKWGVFLAAFRVYCARRVAVVAAAFDDDREGVEATLSAYFDAIVDECMAHPDRRGCLMLNTISEFGTDDDVQTISTEAIDAMERAVSRGLARVVPPETSYEDVALTAVHAVALSQAVIQLSRAGRPAPELRRIGRQAAAFVQAGLLAS